MSGSPTIASLFAQRVVVGVDERGRPFARGAARGDKLGVDENVLQPRLLVRREPPWERMELVTPNAMVTARKRRSRA